MRIISLLVNDLLNNQSDNDEMTGVDFLAFCSDRNQLRIQRLSPNPFSAIQQMFFLDKYVRIHAHSLELFMYYMMRRISLRYLYLYLLDCQYHWTQNES